MPLKINPFATSNPMTWKEAAIISGVLTAGSFFTVFLVGYNLLGVNEDLPQFCFAVIQFLGASFFTDFIGLAGLAQLTQKSVKNQDIQDFKDAKEAAEKVSE